MEACVMVRGLGLRGDFRMKVAAALAVVVLGDGVVWRLGQHGGVWGAVLMVLPGLALATRPAVRRDWRAWVWLGLALVMGFAFLVRPGVLAWCLFWVFAGVGALLPAVDRFGDGWQWAQRLVLHGLRSVVAPGLDLVRWIRAGQRRGGFQARVMLSRWALPAGGSAVILLLFAQANPVIELWLDGLGDLLRPDLWIGRVLLWPMFFALGWAVLRPRVPYRVFGTFDGGGDLALPGVSVGSVVLSLIAFNALFALQNAMDLAWLWGLVPLPRGMTLADYAHRGAYPLIVTALLAAGFVLVALRPGSQTAALPAVRRMVVLWVAQNVLLVVSAGLRTLDYIAAYSLTALRIAALLWMGLVALGLVLVCWRMLRDKSASWLINANVAAALALLTGCSFVDMDTIAARYNIDHARELGGDGAPIDVCYLADIGPSAIMPLADLERRHAPEAIHLWAQVLRENAQTWLITDQTEGDWSWLGAMRLAALPAGLKSPGLFGPAPDCRSRDVHALRFALGLDHEPAPKPAGAPLTAPSRP
jgi:hypothetical protein